MRCSGVFLGLVLGAVACNSANKDSGADELNTEPDGFYPSSLSPGATVSLASCTGGVSESDISKTVAIVFDMEQSYHEMIGCGGLVVALASAVLDVITSMVDDPKGGLPNGFSQDGAGTYTSSPGGNTVMEMRFVYGDTYEVGAEGEPVQYNLFKLSNYLVNPRVDFDYSAGKLLIRYDEAGPLVELLGFGANPDRPIRIDLDNLGRITREIDKLGVTSSVIVADAQNNSDVSYLITSGGVTIKELVSGKAFGFDLETTEAVHRSMPQQADVDLWTVKYADNAMDGKVEFDVVGGVFEYQGQFVYRDRTWPDITLTCID